jgi:hypothetical protein
LDEWNLEKRALAFGISRVIKNVVLPVHATVAGNGPYVFCRGQGRQVLAALL